MMKLLVALCALLSSVSLSPVNKPQQPVRLTQGQTYLYEYSGRLLTGIPELANQFSGFEIVCDLILQPISESVVAFKLANVRIGQHNGQVPNNNYRQPFVMNHLPDAQYTKELQKPIRFQYNDGKVVAFEADQSEPEWSLNIKKSILSLFNINLTPKKIIRSVNNNQVPKVDLDLTVYPVYEEGIGGICETVYEINNIPYINDLDAEQAFVLNVTKTRNYDNCLTEPTIVNDNFDVRGCPWVCRKEKSFAAVPGYYPTPDEVNDPYMSGCPCGQEPQESPVDSYNYVYYNISLQQPNPIIESIYSEGKISYNSYGDELLVIVQQNVSLVEAGSVAVQIQSIPRPQRHNELAFRLPKPQLPAGPKAPLDIPYYHLFGQPNIAELSNVIPELLDSLASDIVAGDVSVSKDSMAKSVQIVNALAVLPVSALEQLFEDVAQEGQSYKATPKQQVVRKLFLDSLPLAGSNQAAIFIKVLIEQNKVTTYEAKELVEAVPQNLFLPDIATIDAYLELFQNPKVQNRRHLAASTGIAFGKMVKEACVKRQYTPGDIPDDNSVPYSKRNLNAQLVVQPSDPQNPQRVKVQQVLPAILVTPQQRTGFSGRMKRSATWESAFNQDVCDEQDLQKYVQIIGRLFQNSQQYYKKMALIETLAHMGVYQVLPYFEPYISGEVSQQNCPGYVVEHPSRNGEECDFVRQVIIYSLSHITEYYPKQVLPLVLPVYNNPSNSYEIRIAAFTTLIFADVDRPVLERIASQLAFENNRQVKSFVYSALKTIGNFSLPCFEKMARNADYAYNHAPNIEYGMQYSKMFGYDYYDSARDYGLYTLFESVSSNISQVPRSGYFSIGQSNGPFQDELLQFGFNAKGVESLVKRVLEPNGLLSDMFEGIQAKPKDRRINKRNTDSVQQALEALKNKLNLNYRTDDEPKATVFFKLFDRTSYYALDRAYISQLIDDAEDSLKDIAASLTQGANFHYVKLIMPSQLYKVVPSELGLPVVITHRHPMIFSIKVDNAKLQLATGQKTIYPIGVNFTALIQPSFYYSSYSFMFAINPASRQSYGVHVEKTTQATFPVEVSVGYVRPKNLFTASFIPKAPQEIVYHKTQASTFIAKANIAGAPDRNWLQDAEPIKTLAVPFQYDKQVGQELLGLGVRVQLNSENVWHDQPFYLSPTAIKQGYIPALVEGFRNPGLQARELHVQLQPDQNEPVYGYDFSLRYKWVAEDQEGADDDDSDESSASDESDSDESDESSASRSSESRSSASNSDEAGKLKTKTGSQIKRKIEARFSKVVQQNSQSQQNQQQRQQQQQNQQNQQSQRYKSRNHNNRNQQNENEHNLNGNKQHQNEQNRQESHESSHESSNESGSKSSPKSGSKASSQSSSSESHNGHHNKHRHNHNHHNRHINQNELNQRNSNNQYNVRNSRQRRSSESLSPESSESSSSSSSASDESTSFEDSVFDYDDVMKLILGQEFKKRSIKRISKELVYKTRSAWEWAWDDDEDQSSSDESNQNEQSQVPATIAHDFAITAVARGPRPTYYAANVLYVHTYDHRTIWFKSDGHIKSPVGVYMQVPTLFCADAVIAYPVYPGEFYYDPTSMQAQKAKIQAQAGWGPQCQHDGGVIITGVMETTEDQVIPYYKLAVQDGSSPLHVQNWYYKQCQIDRAEGQPLSYACERSIIEESYFNQIILDVKYKNLPKQFINATQQLDLALKVAYYQNLENNYLDVDNPNNQIRLVAQYSSRIPNVPLANLLIKKPYENSQFKKIYVPYLRPVSSLLPYREIYANLLTDYQYTDTCNLMEDYVRTFDNVTYQLPDNPCQYLVAKDCSPYERFAVYASQLDQEAKTKAVTIVANGIQIKLTPPTQQNLLQVVVDSKTYELTPRKPITLEGNKNDIRIYLRMTVSQAVNPIAVVEIDNQNLQVLYDGKNARVLIGNQYQGITCGLCGDNNDESNEEFVGPDQCIYEQSYDFANSYALSGLHCEQIPIPEGYKRCPLHQRFFQPKQQELQDNLNNNQESGIVNQKVVKVVQTPQGQTTLVRQEVNEQLGARDRQNILEGEANYEELNRKQQNQQEKVQARQNGQSLLPEQSEPLYGANAQQQKILSRMRTLYIERDDMICFTTKPVRECYDYAVPSQTTQQFFGFHCLPKDSQITQQFIIDAQKQVIKQFANKRADIRQSVTVPVQCVQNNVAVVQQI